MTNARPDASLPPIRQPVAVPPATGNVDPTTLVFSEDIAFIDVETTGLDPEVDRIVEIAIYRTREGVPEVFHTLVNPGMPIPPTASAVHHITDDMVADKPTFEEIIPEVVRMVDGAFVGSHNAPFDCLFVDPAVGVEPDPKAWFCTVRLAKHLTPHAPAFGNQVLRYWFKTQPASEGLGDHRAIDDVHVSMENLRHLLKVAQDRGIKTMQEILDLSNEPIISLTMPFGEHIGKEFDKIPSSYLNWALGNLPGKKGLDLDPDLRITMERALAAQDRPADVVVPATVMTYGKKFADKPMAEVDADYLQWIQHEKPRGCSQEIIQGAVAELQRRGIELAAPAPRTSAPAAAKAPAELDLKIEGLSPAAQVTFNRLAALVAPGSKDEAALQEISHCDAPAEQFERYLREFARAGRAEYERVAQIVQCAEYMLRVAPAPQRQAANEPAQQSAPRGPGRISLLGARQPEPDHEPAEPPPDMDESAPFVAASGNRRPRMS
ncbi:DNA polymerase III epsilon subunit family exonuclease [Roseateles asaccharophilus]|uniref:3'-5' exonuclease n=1 Tax=Roseateles asaccharophilus TaxID=582607 RepID=UPI0038393283